MTKRVSTAAYLAGVTTLAVSLPMMASARTHGPDLVDQANAQDTSCADMVQMDRSSSPTE